MFDLLALLPHNVFAVRFDGLLFRCTLDRHFLLEVVKDFLFVAHRCGLASGELISKLYDLLELVAFFVVHDVPLVDFLRSVQVVPHPLHPLLKRLVSVLVAFVETSLNALKFRLQLFHELLLVHSLHFFSFRNFLKVIHVPLELIIRILQLLLLSLNFVFS